MLDCRRGSNGARILRSPSHCTPRKKGCCLISCAPPTRPKRFSTSQMSLDETIRRAKNQLARCSNAPSHKVLSIAAQRLVGWEMQVARPVVDLAVRFRRLLGAERRPTDQAFEHDGADGPPVTRKVIALTAEDFRRDVVGRANGRVGQLAARLAPRVDLRPVRHGELDLVQARRVAIVARRPMSASEELSVIGRLVLFVKAGGKTKVGQLDVTTAIQQNVVGLDVPAACQPPGTRRQEMADRWMKPSLWTASMARAISAM